MITNVEGKTEFGGKTIVLVIDEEYNDSTYNIEGTICKPPYNTKEVMVRRVRSREISE